MIDTMNFDTDTAGEPPDLLLLAMFRKVRPPEEREK